MAEIAENLLYECLAELSYVQEVEDCASIMCKSSNGRELIERGMVALNIRELAEDTLDAQRLAEWNKMHGTTDCEHIDVFWYDKNGIGVSREQAYYGRCADCEEKIVPDGGATA